MKVIAVLVCLGLAATALAAGHRPPLGLTPVGYMPHECTHHAPEGSEVISHGDGHFTIYHADGRQVRSTESCRKAMADLQLPNGWTAYTYASTTKNLAFSSFLGTWNVPAAPNQQDQQTLFTFTGLQNGYSGPPPPGGISIIQPVLQYGPSEAGGGSYWSIASWYVADSGAVYSTLQTVNSGDSIFGNMTLQKDGKWFINAVSKQSGKSSSINVRVSTPELWAFVTLEVYSIQSCNDFPKGSISYSGLAIQTGSSSYTPKWQTESQNACNERVQVSSPSAVTLTF